MTKTFPGVRALNNVSLSLHEGEVHAIVGENGAGKSTLIHLAAGVYMPDAGEIQMLGGDSYSTPIEARQNGVVTVFQESELFDHLSVAENIALLQGLPIDKLGFVDWTQIHVSAQAYLQQLPEPIDSRVSAASLSVAQRQMLQVASAVAQNANVLILDEPTQGLAQAEIENLIALIRDISKSVNILLIEHNMAVVFSLAEYVTVMDSGGIMAEGTPSEIENNREVQDLYLGN